MKKISLHIHTPENPHRDWRLTLLCFIVLLVIFVIVSVFFYNNLLIEVENEIVQNSSGQILNRIDFDETVEALNEKKLNPSPVPERVTADPSI